MSWSVDYRYSLPNYKLFSSYGMEQQAAIVADYFYIKNYGIGGFNKAKKLTTFVSLNKMDLMKKYEWTLRRFLKDPSYRGNI
jgi:hypothetical protein